MKLAFTISSYRLTSFVKLGILQIRKFVPDADILISDDNAQESESIRQVAITYGCHYIASKTRRGHFASDLQSIVNSLVFGQACGADIALKISQRFIFRKPEGIEVIRKAFADPNIMVATPGQPIQNNGTRAGKGFCAFGTLSDIVIMRVGCMSAQELLQLYRERIRREQVPWASFIECTVDELHSRKFPGRTVKIPELTNPTADPIYLRRYQANEKQYRDLALAHGFNAQFLLGEWGQLEQRAYLSIPVVV